MPNISATFPPQTGVPKTEEWAKQCLDYSIYSWDNLRTTQIAKINKLYENYNGIIDNTGLDFVNKTYGKENITKYIDYRLARPKIDLVQGEWLGRPLNSTVYTINKDAKSAKLNDYEVKLGMVHAAKEIEKLRSVVGVDVFDGMPIPETDADGGLSSDNIKTKNEMVMQTILNDQIKRQDLRTKLSSNFRDVEIAAECFGKVYIDNNGDVVYREIDPRDAIFEEIDRDPFLLQSPYMGERRLMFIHDILAQINLTPKQRTELTEIGYNSSDYISARQNNTRQYYQLIQKKLALEVFTLEWYSFRTFYTKVIPDKKNPELPFRKAIDEADYIANKTQIEKDVLKGKYTIETKLKKIIWEGTRIGNDIYVNMREKPNIIGSIDRPFDTTMSYTGMLFNTIDNVRISLQESLINIGRVYNMVMFQINRELAKSKGKVVAYDRAYLPKNKTMKDVLHRMTNDGIYDYNSAEDGNISGQKVEINGAIREIDLGVSQSMQVLLGLKLELQMTADKLSGINEERSGNIAASSTATGAQLSQQASRTLTEPMFYMFSRFTENVFNRVCEYSKISWGLLKPEQGAMIIGDDGVKFLRATKDIANDDYGVYLADGKKEMEIRSTIRQLSMAAVNSGELRIHDVAKFELEDTLAGAIGVVEKGWKEVKQIAAQQQQAQADAAQQQLETKLEISKEEREDQQLNLANLEILKADLTRGTDTLKAKNDYLLNEQAYIQKQAEQQNNSPQA